MSDLQNPGGTMSEQKPDCVITVSQNAYSALKSRVKELEQIMVMHFITLDDYNKPEDDQGEQRAKEFRAECGRIIMRQAKEASKS